MGGHIPEPVQEAMRYCADNLNDMDILKSSVVELKQRLDRVEKHTKMPESESKPIVLKQRITGKETVCEYNIKQDGDKITVPYTPEPSFKCQDFRWGEKSPGCDERAAQRRSGYDYAMAKVSDELEKVLSYRKDQISWKGQPSVVVAHHNTIIDFVDNELKERLGLFE